jgi:hypothetical protein
MVINAAPTTAAQQLSRIALLMDACTMRSAG